MTKSTQRSAVSSQPKRVAQPDEGGFFGVPLDMVKAISNATELTLMRQALQEAISSVESVLDSNLPPHVEDYTERDNSLHAKWTVRIMAWKQLLQSLGGSQIGDGELSWQDFAPKPKTKRRKAGAA